MNELPHCTNCRYCKKCRDGSIKCRKRTNPYAKWCDVDVKCIYHQYADNCSQVDAEKLEGTDLT